MELVYKKAERYTEFRTCQLKKQEQKKDNHSINFDLKQDDDQIRLYINSQLIEDENYFLQLKGASLILFIFVKTKIEKPLYMHHISINAFEENQSEELRSCEYVLPGYNYRIKRTRWEKDKNRLEIILGKKIKKYNHRNNLKTYRRKRS
jgi:hypothetical protein